MISKRNLRKKERKGAQDRKLIDRPCETNIYWYWFWKPYLIRKYMYLIFCCQWWSTINLFSNYWTNWTYSRRGFTRNILAAWLSTRQETKRPNTIFSKKRFLKKEHGFDIVYYIRDHTNWWIVLWRNWFISSTGTLFISIKMFIMHAMKKKHYEDWEIREKCKYK